MILKGGPRATVKGPSLAPPRAFWLLGASAGRQKEPMCEGQTPQGGLAASLPAVSPASQTRSLFSASFKPSASPFTTFSQNKDKEWDGLFLGGEG